MSTTSDSQEKEPKGPIKEVREDLRKMVNEQTTPIYENIMKLLETDGKLLRSLGELHRGKRLTIREQAILQNILYGLISTQGDTEINLLKTLDRIRDAQLQSFDLTYYFFEALLHELAEQVINPIKEETRNLGETLHQRLAELSKPRELELKVPANIQKELQLWLQERERAKKAAEKYTG